MDQGAGLEISAVLLATWLWGFSVSPSQVNAVLKYVENQEEHHRTHSFQEEYREFLHKYGVEFDERYVWD